MAWIESHQSLGTHLKLRRLARELRVHRAQAIGHLHFLWWWALDNAPTGDLSALAPAEIAEVAEWPGDETQFVSALKGCRFIDDDGKLHDWSDYAGKLIEKRKADADRKRVQRTSNGHPTDGAGTVPYRTVPYSTQPYPTRESAPPDTPPAPRANGQGRRPASLADCLTMADRLGMPPEDAKRWHADMEAANWSKVDGTPFGNWPREMAIHRDRLRSGVSGQRTANQNAPTRQPGALLVVWQKRLESVERELHNTRPEGLRELSHEEKEARRKLRAERDDLNRKLKEAS